MFFAWFSLALSSMGSPKPAVSGDVDAAEAERIVQEWLAPSALARIRLREKYA